MSSTGTSPQIVEEVIFDALAQLGPERSAVTREATFEELDLDSLDLVEIAQIVEEKWGIEFDPQDFANVKTVGEALDLVLARMS
ncbi:MAG TPA: phosphopantetheine-binding protein [Conexibacter sp.]|nr:phosphopantetheine-binding protein [Conexibacter sp.]